MIAANGTVATGSPQRKQGESARGIGAVTICCTVRRALADFPSLALRAAIDKVLLVRQQSLPFKYHVLGEAMVNAEVTKRLLAFHGEVRSQPSSDWTGPFPLPPVLEKFYREVGPLNVTIRAYGNPYFLPSLADLWQFQAGYRWNGLSGEPIEDWPDDWLVVADESGDPFIFVRSSNLVLHAYHGEGEWDAGEMFSDLNTMAACLAQIGCIVLEAGSDFTEDDCTIRPKYRTIASVRLQELLGSKSDGDAVLGALGWG